MTLLKIRIAAIATAILLVAIACASSTSSRSVKADDGTDSRFTVTHIPSSLYTVVDDSEKHNTCYFVDGYQTGAGVSCIPDR